MTKLDLLTLANRVETEHPTPELTALVLTAIGSEAEPGNAPDPLTSIDDAARLVPEGWILFMVIQTGGGISATLGPLHLPDHDGSFGMAPTEPRARTAAALRAIAVGRE